ncbi:MAG: hypothetical protein HY926_05525 [Elusimicrobia bacterium]|nr:hypothetical protein [Elusimicrobiota bacterium]
MRTAGLRLALSLLAVLAAANVHLKLRQSVALPRYDPDDETAYFRAESALQYRYARLAASGAAIPELDRDAQHPEGIRTRREITLAMERATGWTWRVLNLFTPLRDLRWFVLVWAAVLASLTIPALYAAALSLSRSPPLALAAAAAFALSWAGMSNGIGTYGFESFALPMLLGSLAFLLHALDRETARPRLPAAAAGLLMAAALASWHFSSFHLAAVFLALGWAAWRRRRDAQDLRRLAEAAAALGLGALAAVLLCAHLREALRAPAGAYGHVYGLLWEKLRHGLVQPADPAQLNPHARLLWSGPFRSPEPGFLLVSFLPLAALALPRLAALLGRKEAPAEASSSLVSALLLLYLAGTALVARLTPILAFLLCAAACRLPPRWLRGAWLPAFFLAVALLEGAKSLAPASRLNPFLMLSAAATAPERRPAGSFADELALIRWLARNGGPDQPVLAGYGLSSSLLTYAGSPILLQPKFEAPAIRAKTLEFLRALYGGEADFTSFCRRYGAALYVHSVDAILDETPDGPRYASGSLRLRADAAAVLFQFHPERLKGFSLRYENAGFRVFAVGAPGKAPASRDPIYDISRYAPQLEGGFLSLDVAGVNGSMAGARRALLLARILVRMGRGEEALAAYAASFAAWPPDPAVREEAGRLRAALSGTGIIHAR